MALRADTIREFGELFERDEPPRAQTHRAVVTAVDGGTVYVDVSGSGEPTPIETTSAGYAIGDEVQVEQRGGRLHVSGNVTQPSVGAQHVEQAVAPVARTAAQAQSASQSAQRVATEAQAVADATAQHFFDDSDGIHVTEADRDTWAQQHSGKNILINSFGILLRNALNNLVSITASAIAFFDGSGNAASNVVAQFGASGAQIGKSGAAHSVIDADGQRFYAGDGTTQLANIGYGEGAAESGTATAPYYTLGERTANSTIGNYSVAEGRNATASGYASHAEGYNTTASGTSAHAEGYYTSTSRGYTHAEGAFTSASAICAHAQNRGTDASGYCQTAMGMYNLVDSSDTYALIIGNGRGIDTRSNALMVDWDGYIYPCAEKMPDFVVEQGTSGIWTYRKWHSGVAECWGTYSASIAITSSSASYGGYRSAQITATAFPSGTFSAAPTVTATSMSSGGNWVTNVEGSTATAIKFFLSCGTSSAASTRNIAFHAIGKWK